MVEQDAKPVQASASFWRPNSGEQRKEARRAGIARGVLFLMILLDKQKNHATRRAEKKRVYIQTI
ncbi:MAG: hypothetical protein HKP41_15225 [Desulfobacterales bacterium]|nr:hypothetical protein [Desulfobacterales bacterium]